MDWNLRVSVSLHQGDRKYMEDEYCVHYERDPQTGSILYVYAGIFDGHGGPDAARYAKSHLHANITKLEGFRSHDDRLVMKAITDGFINTHQAMWRELPNWPRTASGLPSTTGTTASVAFLMRGKLYTGHVGDSAIVVGTQKEGRGKGPLDAMKLTRDHKPDCTDELARIESAGGSVVSKAGVDRVVWRRPSPANKGPVRRSTTIDNIPFLAVSRSLGDLWSYDFSTGKYAVSPDPDVGVMSINPQIHKCVVLASDGVWNVMSSQSAVTSVEVTERKWFQEALCVNSESAASVGHTRSPDTYYHSAATIVTQAHRRWHQRSLRADNASAVVIMIDSAGPSLAHELTVLQRTAVERSDTPCLSQHTVQGTDQMSDTALYLLAMADTIGCTQPCYPEVDLFCSCRGKPLVCSSRSATSSLSIYHVIVQTAAGAGHSVVPAAASRAFVTWASTTPVVGLAPVKSCTAAAALAAVQQKAHGANGCRQDERALGKEPACAPRHSWVDDCPAAVIVKAARTNKPPAAEETTGHCPTFFEGKAAGADILDPDRPTLPAHDSPLVAPRRLQYSASRKVEARGTHARKRPSWKLSRCMSHANPLARERCRKAAPNIGGISKTKTFASRKERASRTPMLRLRQASSHDVVNGKFKASLHTSSESYLCCQTSASLADSVQPLLCSRGAAAYVNYAAKASGTCYVDSPQKHGAAKVWQLAHAGKLTRRVRVERCRPYPLVHSGPKKLG